MRSFMTFAAIFPSVAPPSLLYDLRVKYAVALPAGRSM